MRPILRHLLARRGLLAVACLSALVLLLVALRRDPPPSVCLLGDARARVEARVPAELAHAYVDAGQFTLGVGAGAVGSWEGLGEALAVGGEVFVRSTDKDTPQYYRLLRARRFQTNSFAFVPLGTVPRERLALRAGSTFAQLWQELGARYPEGVLAAGIVQFHTLKTIAISRPAIRGLAVPANAAHYYTEPLESMSDVRAYVVGLAGHSGAKRRGDPLFARLLAPRGDGHLDTFAHVLTLAGAMPGGDPPKGNLEALNLGRVSASSVIERGELALYPASRLGVCDRVVVARPRGAFIEVRTSERTPVTMSQGNP